MWTTPALCGSSSQPPGYDPKNPSEGGLWSDFPRVQRRPTSTESANTPAHPLLPKDFNPEVYLLQNPDVAAARMDPVYHYLHHGRFECRSYKGTAGELG